MWRYYKWVLSITGLVLVFATVEALSITENGYSALVLFAGAVVAFAFVAILIKRNPLDPAKPSTPLNVFAPKILIALTLPNLYDGLAKHRWLLSSLLAFAVFGAVVLDIWQATLLLDKRNCQGETPVREGDDQAHQDTDY